MLMNIGEVINKIFGIIILLNSNFENYLLHTCQVFVAKSPKIVIHMTLRNKIEYGVGTYALQRPLITVTFRHIAGMAIAYCSQP